MSKINVIVSQEELRCLFETVNRVISEEAAFAIYATPEDSEDFLIQDSIAAYQNAVTARECLRRAGE